MKAYQIEKLLHGVYNNLCKSITDPEIVVIIREKSFISGGCIPTMLMDDFVNDFDFYFIDEESANKVKSYYEANKNNTNKDKYHVKLITDNAINLSDKVQLITKFVGTPEKVVNNFDWQHIKSYYKYPDGLSLTSDIYKLIMEKELVYTGSAYPLSSLMRLKKYIKKGWHVSNATIVHIALDFAEDMQKRYEQQNEISSEGTLYCVEDIIYHMNGVDPLTIQKELLEKSGAFLTVKEIVNLIKR
jgi:hypothetical protein